MVFLGFQIKDFDTFITGFLLSLKVWKVKYLSYLLIKSPNLSSESSYGINLQVLYFIFNQPPEEPREHHLGEV